MGLPYVRLKLPAVWMGVQRWHRVSQNGSTGTEAREDVQRLRAQSAAIVTGSGTIIADNPALTVRSKQLGVDLHMLPKPKVVIVDRRNRLSDLDDYQVLNRDDTLIWRNDLMSLLKLWYHNMPAMMY